MSNNRVRIGNLSTKFISNFQCQTIEQHDLNFKFKQSIPRRSSGALYQKVTTTGSSSASGFRGLLKSRAKPMSVIFSVPFSGPEIREGTVKMSIFSSKTCSRTKCTVHCIFYNLHGAIISSVEPTG